MENKKVIVWRFVFGILMLFAVVWRIHSAEKSRRIVSSIISQVYKANAARIDPVNEGVLVYLNGRITAGAELTDGFVSAGPSVYFKKKIETYQWYQKNKKYYSVWSEKILDDPDYDTEHKNHLSKYGETKVFMAKQFSLGAFNLRARDFSTLNLISLDSLPELSGLYRHGGVYYSGNPSAPKIGDVRISYYFLPVGAEISVVGAQKGNFIEPLNGIIYAENGSVSREDLIMNHFNRVKGGKMQFPRFVSFVLMYIAVYFTLSALPWMMQKSKIYFYAVVTFFAFTLTWFISLFSEMI